MKRVTGLGGIFFKTQDVGATREWYRRHLGINLDPQYGTSFEWRSTEDPDRKGFTAWSPFPVDTDYFAPSGKDFMINYLVANLEGLLAAQRRPCPGEVVSGRVQVGRSRGPVGRCREARGGAIRPGRAGLS